MADLDQKASDVACIFCSGTLTPMDRERARDLAQKARLIIAADGGARHVSALGLKPHAIIGDMDSLSQNPWAEDPEVDKASFPVDKDCSDTELAIRWAFEKGAGKALLLGAMGGRPDHVCGHFALLGAYPGQVGIWDQGFFLHALAAEEQSAIRTYPGATISLFPMSADTRVQLKGMQYELPREFFRYATHGLSNRALDEQCHVTVKSGIAILCAEGQKTWLDL